MSTALRSVFALTLACFLSPKEASAQQLYQPSSVSPWVPARVWKTHDANPTERTFDFPLPLLDPTDRHPQTVARTKVAQSLPMVETECFVLLGQIRADKIRRSEVVPTATPIATDPSTEATDSFPPLEFLRASGILSSNRSTRL